MKYSIIVPVYTRPDETEELLASLCKQARPDMQVIIVEDGSQIPCEDVVKRYAGRMNVEYFNKENGGPAELHVYPTGRHGWIGRFEYWDENRAALIRWLGQVREGKLTE